MKKIVLSLIFMLVCSTSVFGQEKENVNTVTVLELPKPQYPPVSLDPFTRNKHIQFDDQKIVEASIELNKIALDQLKAEVSARKAEIDVMFKWLDEHGIPRDAKATACLEGDCRETTAARVAKIFSEQEQEENHPCGICPQNQEPPPTPGTLPGFCTGLRDEYLYIDNSWLGGVAEAYNYCLEMGTVNRQCSRPYCPNRPGEACTCLGWFNDSYTWNHYAGECLRHCTKCSCDI